MLPRIVVTVIIIIINSIEFYLEWRILILRLTPFLMPSLHTYIHTIRIHIQEGTWNLQAHPCTWTHILHMNSPTSFSHLPLSHPLINLVENCRQSLSRFSSLTITEIIITSFYLTIILSLIWKKLAHICRYFSNLHICFEQS